MAGWTNSTGTGTGNGGGRGAGGRGFANRRPTGSDIVHGGSSAGGGGRWRGDRSRGRRPPQPHYHYRPVDRHRSPGSQGAASSTSTHQEHINHPAPAPDKASSPSVPRSSAKDPDDKSGRNAANFECNVCFDMAAEPVVTKCGHLFCWECLYQWLHVHSHHRECPVCKGQVAHDAIIPIYGRGGSAASVEYAPPRPAGARVESSRQQHHHHNQQHLPSFSFPMVILDEEEDEEPIFQEVFNFGSSENTSIRDTVMRFMPPSFEEALLEDQYDDYDSYSFDEVYHYNYFDSSVFGAEDADRFSPEGHVDLINHRDNNSGPGTINGPVNPYRNQEYGNPGANARTNHRNRGRHGRRNRARSSADQSSTEAVVLGSSLSIHLDNSASSNVNAAGASSRPNNNGGWAERRGRSRRNSRGMPDAAGSHETWWYGELL